MHEMEFFRTNENKVCVDKVMVRVTLLKIYKTNIDVLPMPTE